MLFNINDYVRVRLTPLGRQIHRDYWMPVAVKAKQVYLPVEEEDGWSKWQMWELMQVYGKHIGNGMELPFEITIDIVTTRADLSRDPYDQPPDKTSASDLDQLLAQPLVETAPLSAKQQAAVDRHMALREQVAREMAVEVIDRFDGDNAALIQSAKALLSLDADGALVPHGIGDHARTIIEAFICRTVVTDMSRNP